MDNQSYPQSYLFGQRFKNRLFVGGLPLNTTAKELAEFFSHFSRPIEAKIIYDDQQVAKGYGFVTFSNEEDVQNVTHMGTLFLRNKKLNLGPAVRKQQVSAAVEPELVVVTTNNMRGDYYYPVHVPHAAQQYIQYPPVMYPAMMQVPMGYTCINDQPEQLSSPAHYFTAAAPADVYAPRQQTRKGRHVPPRFRRPREI